MNLYSILQPHLEHSPHDSMLIQDGQSISYQQFDGMVQRTEVWLNHHGVKAGDHVAVWLINRAEWLALLFALTRVGATLVAVNTKYRSHELQYILTHSKANLLILQLNFGKIDFAEVLSGVDRFSLPHLKNIAVIDADHHTPKTLLDRPVIGWNPDAQSAQECVSLHRVHPEAPAVFFTTSGTTKGPKLVIHSQRTLSEHSRHIAAGYQFNQPGNKLLAALPLCGVFGLNSALGAIASGMPVVLMDFFDVETATSLIKHHAVTHIFGSDEMLRMFVAHNVEQIPFPSLKLFGFASFSPRFIELAETLIPRGFPMRGLYGSSEVQALFALQAANLPIEERALGGGMPASGPLAHVRARDPETGVLSAHGVAGELEIKSPTLFCGYFNNPDATADAFTIDGYFKTGDLGHTRADGSFVYLARMGDTMRIGGFLVDPSEIEHVLAQQPEIQSAQVVGMEIDGKLRTVAFVIGTQPAAHHLLEADDMEQRHFITGILERVGAQLAKFKIPARLWFIDAFPATASANGLKFQRVKLREMAQHRLNQESAHPTNT